MTCNVTNIYKDGERSGRYRPLRSKGFLDRLKRAKEQKESIKVKIVDSTLSSLGRTYTVVSGSGTYSSVYRIILGKSPSCNCADFNKNDGKELCKHIIWIYLYICKIPENSSLLQQIHLTQNEVSTVLGNSPTIIPEELKFRYNTNQSRTRREIVQDLLDKDSRNKNSQDWTLSLKKKKKGMTPRCRACRKEHKEGDLTVSVKGLYVPYEQTFVTETMFYFCPNVDCVKKIPAWTNLRPPTNITAENTIDEAVLNKFKQDGLPVFYSALTELNS